MILDECQGYRNFEQEQTKKNTTQTPANRPNPLQLPGAGAPIVLTLAAIHLRQHDIVMAI
jgi:hypothetical protein